MIFYRIVVLFLFCCMTANLRATPHVEQLLEATYQDLYPWKISFVEDRLSDQDIVNEQDVGEFLLIKDKVFTINEEQYIQFSQYYQGVPICGKSITARYKLGNKILKKSLEKASFSGSVVKGISSVKAESHLKFQDRIVVAESVVDSIITKYGLKREQIDDIDYRPIFWVDSKQKLVPTLKVSLYAKAQDGGIPLWLHSVVDLKTKETYLQWNQIRLAKSYIKDQGPGGNYKTGRYIFGQSLPALKVYTHEHGQSCLLSSQGVRVFDLEERDVTSNNLRELLPVSYTCFNNQGDVFWRIQRNQAFSAANDVYAFSQLVFDMLREWYGVENFIVDRHNQTIPANLLVHVGNSSENAYWDGYNKLFVFGNGSNHYYPMTSLDIVAHEIGHALTEYYTNLAYLDQSGAIDESFSDMLSIAVKMYLLERYHEGYTKLFPDGNIEWEFGNSITKYGGAIRSFRKPSKYGGADCYTRTGGCTISYHQIKENLKPHLGSGVMSRAFYLLALELGLKDAFRLFLVGNRLFWQSDTDFSEAAYGIKRAAAQLPISTQLIERVFSQVGVKIPRKK